MKNLSMKSTTLSYQRQYRFPEWSRLDFPVGAVYSEDRGRITVTAVAAVVIIIVRTPRRAPVALVPLVGPAHYGSMHRPLRVLCQV